MNKAPVPATPMNTDVPVELERIIGKALEKDRDSLPGLVEEVDG